MLVAICTSITFFATSLGLSPGAYAAPAMPEVSLPYQVAIDRHLSLAIPEELGKLEKFNEGAGDQPAIFHIQTAHGHYEAQQQVRKILHYLDTQYGVNTVLVEGSAFQLDPNLLNFFPKDPALTRKINDELTKRALVKGPELYLLDSEQRATSHESRNHEPRATGHGPGIVERGPRAYGIEHLESYRENGLAFVEVLDQKEKTSQFLADMDMQIDRLASRMLNKDLRDLLRRVDSFEKNRIPLDVWLKDLKGEAQKHLEIDLVSPAQQLDWPMMVRFFKMQELAAKLDLQKFPEEREAFLKTLKRFLPVSLYAEIEQILTSDQMSRQLSDPETELLFEDMVKHLPGNFHYDAFPNVRSYIGTLLLQSELKADRLFFEAKALSAAIASKLTRNQGEKQLVALLADHRLLQKLFSLELMPEDYEMVLARSVERGVESRRSVKPSAIVRNFENVTSVSSQRGATAKFSHIDELDALYEKAMKFYAGVKERDGAMEKRIEERLREAGANKVAVITGGFHSRPLSDHFSAQNCTYALISPKLTSSDESGHAAYERNMMQFAQRASHRGWTKNVLTHNAQRELVGGSSSSVERRTLSAKEATREMEFLTDPQVLSGAYAINAAAMRSEVKKIIQEVAGREGVLTGAAARAEVRDLPPPRTVPDIFRWAKAGDREALELLAQIARDYGGSINASMKAFFVTLGTSNYHDVRQLADKAWEALQEPENNARVPGDFLAMVETIFAARTIRGFWNLAERVKADPGQFVRDPAVYGLIRGFFASASTASESDIRNAADEVLDLLDAAAKADSVQPTSGEIHRAEMRSSSVGLSISQGVKRGVHRVKALEGPSPKTVEEIFEWVERGDREALVILALIAQYYGGSITRPMREYFIRTTSVAESRAQEIARQALTALSKPRDHAEVTAEFLEGVQKTFEARTLRGFWRLRAEVVKDPGRFVRDPAVRELVLDFFTLASSDENNVVAGVSVEILEMLKAAAAVKETAARSSAEPQSEIRTIGRWVLRGVVLILSAAMIGLSACALPPSQVPPVYTPFPKVILPTPKIVKPQDIKPPVFPAPRTGVPTVPSIPKIPSVPHRSEMRDVAPIRTVADVFALAKKEDRGAFSVMALIAQYYGGSMNSAMKAFFVAKANSSDRTVKRIANEALEALKTENNKERVPPVFLVWVNKTFKAEGRDEVIRLAREVESNAAWLVYDRPVHGVIHDYFARQALSSDEAIRKTADQVLASLRFAAGKMREAKKPSDARSEIRSGVTLLDVVRAVSITLGIGFLLSLNPLSQGLRQIDPGIDRPKIGAPDKNGRAQREKAIDAAVEAGKKGQPVTVVWSPDGAVVWRGSKPAKLESVTGTVEEFRERVLLTTSDGKHFNIPLDSVWVIWFTGRTSGKVNRSEVRGGAMSVADLERIALPVFTKIEKRDGVSFRGLPRFVGGEERLAINMLVDHEETKEGAWEAPGATILTIKNVFADIRTGVLEAFDGYSGQIREMELPRSPSMQGVTLLILEFIKDDSFSGGTPQRSEMRNTDDPVQLEAAKTQRQFSVIAKILSMAAILTTLAGLAGWFLDVNVLASVIPFQTFMPANGVSSLLLVSLGLNIFFVARCLNTRVEREKERMGREEAESALAVNEAKHKERAALSPVGIFETDLSGVLDYANDMAFSIFGYAKEDISKGLNVLELLAPEDRERGKRRLGEILKHGENGKLHLSGEYTAVRKDGSRFSVSISTRVRFKDGKPVGFRGVLSDITERKKAEKTLQDVIDRNPVSIQILDKEGYTLHSNPAHTQLFGSAPPHGYSLFKDPQILQLGLGDLADRLRSGGVVNIPVVYFNAHDSVPSAPDTPIWLRAVAFPLLDSDGNLEKIVLMHEDITQRRAAEKALAASEQKFREMVVMSPAIFFATDKKGRFLEVSDIGLKQLGYNQEAVKRGLSVGEMIVPEDRQRGTRTMVEILRRGVSSDDPVATEYTALRADGTTFPVLVYMAVRSEEGKPSGFWGVMIDMTRQKAAEATLKENHALLSDFSEHAPGALYQFKLSPDGRFSLPFTNANFVKSFGIDPNDLREDASAIFSAMHPEDRQAVIDSIRESARTLGPWSREFRVVLPGGEVQWRSGRSRPKKTGDGSIVWHGFVQDITERKKAEEELKENRDRMAHQDRLAAVGTLIAGVTHELNNPLAMMEGLGELLARALVQGDIAEAEGYLSTIQENLRRSRKIVRDLLHSVRGKAAPSSKSVFPLERVIQTAIDANSTVLRSRHVDVVTGVDSSLQVYGDEDRIAQVFMNLIKNAADAPNGDADKQITIKAEAIKKKDDRKFIRIMVRDNGLGASSSAHWFDPYFTTKSRELGTGLGLTVVKSFVEETGGSIRATSALGQGTTFEILIPQATQAEIETSDRKTDSATVAVETAEIRQIHKILVVEDEEIIGKLYERHLGDAGYEVIWAKNGDEALKLLELPDHQEKPFDLVMTDFSMKGMNGDVFALAFRDRERSKMTGKAKTPMVLITGFDAGEEYEEALRLMGRGVLDRIESKSAMSEPLLGLVEAMKHLPLSSVDESILVEKEAMLARVRRGDAVVAERKSSSNKPEFVLMDHHLRHDIKNVMTPFSAVPIITIPGAEKELKVADELATVIAKRLGSAEALSRSDVNIAAEAAPLLARVISEYQEILKLGEEIDNLFREVEDFPMPDGSRKLVRYIHTAQERLREMIQPFLEEASERHATWIAPQLEAPASGSTSSVEPPDPASSDVIRILFADDEDSIRTVFSMLLTMVNNSGLWKLEIDTVESGEKALEAVVAKGTGYYDSVVLDNNFNAKGNISGMEVGKKLREEQAFNGSLILASGAKHEGAENWFSGSLLKPFEGDDLRQVILEPLVAQKERHRAAAQSRSESRSRLHTAPAGTAQYAESGEATVRAEVRLSPMVRDLVNDKTVRTAVELYLMAYEQDVYYTSRGISPYTGSRVSDFERQAAQEASDGLRSARMALAEAILRRMGTRGFDQIVGRAGEFIGAIDVLRRSLVEPLWRAMTKLPDGKPQDTVLGLMEERNLATALSISRYRSEMRESAEEEAEEQVEKKVEDNIGLWRRIRRLGSLGALIIGGPMLVALWRLDIQGVLRALLRMTLSSHGWISARAKKALAKNPSGLTWVLEERGLEDTLFDAAAALALSGKEVTHITLVQVLGAVLRRDVSKMPRFQEAFKNVWGRVRSGDVEFTEHFVRILIDDVKKRQSSKEPSSKKWKRHQARIELLESALQPLANRLSQGSAQRSEVREPGTVTEESPASVARRSRGKRASFVGMAPPDVRAKFRIMDAPRIGAIFEEMQASAIAATFRAMHSLKVGAMFGAMDQEKISAMFGAMDPEKISAMFKAMDQERIRAMFQSLNAAKILAMFRKMDASRIGAMFGAMNSHSMAAMFDLMDKDDISAMFKGMDELKLVAMFRATDKAGITAMFRSMDTAKIYAMFREMDTTMIGALFIEMDATKISAMFKGLDATKISAMFKGMGKHEIGAMFWRMDASRLAMMFRTMNKFEVGAMFGAMDQDKVRVIFEVIAAPKIGGMFEALNVSGITAMFEAMSKGKISAMFTAMNKYEISAMFKAMDASKIGAMFKALDASRVDGMFRGMDELKTGAMFEVIDQEKIAAMFGSMQASNVAAMFKAMDASKIALMFKPMDPLEISEMFMAMSQDKIAAMFGAMDQAGITAMFDSMGKEGVVAMFRVLDQERIVEMFEAMDQGNIAAMIGVMDAPRVGAMFRTMDKKKIVAMIGTMDQEKVAAMFGSMSRDKISAMSLAMDPAKHAAMFKAMAPERIVAMIGAMSKDKIAAMFRTMNHSKITAMFRAMDQAKIVAMFRAMDQAKIVAMFRAMDQDKIFAMFAGMDQGKVGAMFGTMSDAVITALRQGPIPVRFWHRIDKARTVSVPPQIFSIFRAEKDETPVRSEVRGDQVPVSSLPSEASAKAVRTADSFEVVPAEVSQLDEVLALHNEKWAANKNKHMVFSKRIMRNLIQKGRVYLLRDKEGERTVRGVLLTHPMQTGGDLEAIRKAPLWKNMVEARGTEGPQDTVLFWGISVADSRAVQGVNAGQIFAKQAVQLFLKDFTYVRTFSPVVEKDYGSFKDKLVSEGWTSAAIKKYGVYLYLVSPPVEGPQTYLDHIQRNPFVTPEVFFKSTGRKFRDPAQNFHVGRNGAKIIGVLPYIKGFTRPDGPFTAIYGYGPGESDENFESLGGVPLPGSIYRALENDNASRSRKKTLTQKIGKAIFQLSAYGVGFLGFNGLRFWSGFGGERAKIMLLAWTYSASPALRRLVVETLSEDPAGLAELLKNQDLKDTVFDAAAALLLSWGVAERSSVERVMDGMRSRDLMKLPRLNSIFPDFWHRVPQQDVSFWEKVLGERLAEEKTKLMQAGAVMWLAWRVHQKIKLWEGALEQLSHRALGVEQRRSEVRQSQTADYRPQTTAKASSLQSSVSGLKSEKSRAEVHSNLVDPRTTRPVTGEIRRAEVREELLLPVRDVVHIAFESADFFGKGGVKDVVRDKPPALLKHMGAAQIVIMPGHPSVFGVGKNAPKYQVENAGFTLSFPIEGSTETFEVYTADADGVRYYFMKKDGYFQNGYLAPNSREGIREYAVFSRAAVELLRKRFAEKKPDVIHLHDAHPALAAPFMRAAFPQEFQTSGIVMTVHNADPAYQQRFSSELFPYGKSLLMSMGMPEWAFGWQFLEFHGGLNLMKAGLVFSEKFTAVSPRYRQELLEDPDTGLRDIFWLRQNDFVGILNGLDGKLWDPATSKHVYVPYDPENADEGKRQNKLRFQKETGLEQDEDAMLVVAITRLADQKGPELILEEARRLLKRHPNVQFAIMGEENEHAKDFRDLMKQYPGRAFFTARFGEAFAQKVLAAGDLFLMPSKYEPCGLSQLQALRFGAVPIGHGVGGIESTIIDPSEDPANATGFKFYYPGLKKIKNLRQSPDFKMVMDRFDKAVERAIWLKEEDPKAFNAMRVRGMGSVRDWDSFVPDYRRLYSAARVNAFRLNHIPILGDARSEVRGDKTKDFRRETSAKAQGASPKSVVSSLSSVVSGEAARDEVRGDRAQDFRRETAVKTEGASSQKISRSSLRAAKTAKQSVLKSEIAAPHKTGLAMTADRMTQELDSAVVESVTRWFRAGILPFRLVMAISRDKVLVIMARLGIHQAEAVKLVDHLTPKDVRLLQEISARGLVISRDRNDKTLAGGVVFMDAEGLISFAKHDSAGFYQMLNELASSPVLERPILTAGDSGTMGRIAQVLLNKSSGLAVNKTQLLKLLDQVIKVEYAQGSLTITINGLAEARRGGMVTILSSEEMLAGLQEGANFAFKDRLAKENVKLVLRTLFGRMRVLAAQLDGASLVDRIKLLEEFNARQVGGLKKISGGFVFDNILQLVQSFLAQEAATAKSA